METEGEVAQPRLCESRVSECESHQPPHIHAVAEIVRRPAATRQRLMQVQSACPEIGAGQDSQTTPLSINTHAG